MLESKLIHVYKFKDLYTLIYDTLDYSEVSRFMSWINDSTLAITLDGIFGLTLYTDLDDCYDGIFETLLYKYCVIYPSNQIYVEM